MEDNDKQKIDPLIEDIVFIGYSTQIIEKFGKKWVFKTLDSEEHLDALALTNMYSDSLSKMFKMKIEILKRSLVSINDIKISEEIKETMFEKLPKTIIELLYEEYEKIETRQRESIKKTNELKNMVKDSFDRIKYKVMKAAGALPTEDRVKKMNDHQWLWYYYNLIEDDDEKEKLDKLKLDFLTWYINPELVKKVNDDKNNNAKSESREVNPNNPNEVIIHKAEVTNDSFEDELNKALGKDSLTQLPDELSKGNANESKDDFISRVIQNQESISEENDKINELSKLNEIERIAKEAGIDPNDIDIFDIE